MKLNLTHDMETLLREHARRYAPEEMCGVIVSGDTQYDYIKVRNAHPDPRNFFMLDPREYAQLDVAHTIAAIVHSHPTGTAQPSADDVSQCNIHKLPYVIVGARDGDVTVTYPAVTPLLGRQYVHGTDDCYGIVRDFYEREMGIPLPDFGRKFNWWNDPSIGSGLYDENAKHAGFVPVPKTTMADLQYGDVLICYWGETLYPNHALIWLGSNTQFTSEDTPECVGETIYLHHLTDSISTRTVMGESRFSSVAYVLRNTTVMTRHTKLRDALMLALEHKGQTQ